MSLDTQSAGINLCLLKSRSGGLCPNWPAWECANHWNFAGFARLGERSAALLPTASGQTQSFMYRSAAFFAGGRISGGSAFVSMMEPAYFGMRNYLPHLRTGATDRSSIEFEAPHYVADSLRNRHTPRYDGSHEVYLPSFRSKNFA
jgi:hypothetical protein